MNCRPYFLIGDLVSNTGVGAVVGLVVASSNGETWWMGLGMAAGMCIGSLVALPAVCFFSVLFGAMEVMLPVMLTGMLAGMLVGMGAAMNMLPGDVAVGIGAVIGLVVLLTTYGLDVYLKSYNE